MVTIIHGSHRHGHSWDTAQGLCTQLNSFGIDIALIDLAVANIDFCCGSQICQETECINKQDEFFNKYKEMIISSDGIFIITPTYFNMPTAKLKNFIDRSNALLPFFENASKQPFFGAYVCGEADSESIKCHLDLLKEYATIMGWENIEQLNYVENVADVSQVDYNKIIKLANIIKRQLQSRGQT